MTHVHDDLSAYILGDLDAAERARVEAHLEGCDACRDELRALEEAYVALVDRLPAEQPPARVWEAIAQRTGSAADERPVGRGASGPRTSPQPAAMVLPGRPHRAHPDRGQPGQPPPTRTRGPAWGPMWSALALAASLIVAATGLLWGWDQRQKFVDVRAEQEQITQWLAAPGVAVRTFATNDRMHGGTVLFRPDGPALVVMRDLAPPRQSYQAWGIGADGVVSLGVLEARTLEVPAEGFAQIAVSLEPAGGSPTPTVVLGGVPTS